MSFFFVLAPPILEVLSAVPFCSSYRHRSFAQPSFLVVLDAMSIQHLREIARFRPALVRVLDHLQNDSLEAAAGSLLELVDETYDLRRVTTDGVQYDDRLAVRQLENSLRYQKRRRKDIESQLDTERNPHRGRMVQALWFVRIGLANPSVPGRTLSSLLSSLPKDECSGVSHYYVGRVRDAFAELLKILQSRELGRQVHRTSCLLFCRLTVGWLAGPLRSVWLAQHWPGLTLVWLLIVFLLSSVQVGSCDWFSGRQWGFLVVSGR